MRIDNFRTRLFVFCIFTAVALTPAAAVAQATVSAPKNRYKIQDDVELGQKTAAEVEQKHPILPDEDATRYVERVGRRLVANIPQQFQQPAFNYQFKVVNASDINAFALPGGPMYVNRGMIEAAQNEGEMAGVMAHEISHVALRHSTAQATKQNSLGGILGTIVPILGGAILGGQTGAQIGALGASAFMTKYSREYESQADVLGARIMADAGYDPRDLANMFQTIARQGGSRGPEWLSSHPDPGNRYQKINQLAAQLRVSPKPIKITRDFERVQARLRQLPPAPTMAEIDKKYNDGQSSSGANPIAGGRYTGNVEYPSPRLREFRSGSLSMSLPSNWRELTGQNEVTFAPDGAYGSQGITHGIMVGVYQSQSQNLGTATETFVRNLLQNNAYLRRESGLQRAYLASRAGYSYSLTGRSPVTNREEDVTVYTTQVSGGRVFYIIAVVPDEESYRYRNTFRNILDSIRLT